MKKPDSPSGGDSRTARVTLPLGAGSKSPLTVRVPPALLEKIRERAAETGRSQNQMLTEMLQDHLANRVETILSKGTIDSAVRGLFAFLDRYMLDDPDPSTLTEDLRHIYEALLDSFAKSFLDEMHKNAARHYLTAGSEAEIFKIHTESGDLIVAKRRFDSYGGGAGTSNEYELQKEARRISKDFPGVSVPKVFARIPDPEEGCEYVVMEYVRGKTLWTLALETVANQAVAAKAVPDPAETDPIRKLYSARKDFEIRFGNDTEAELSILSHYDLVAAERGGANPRETTRDMHGRKRYPNLETYLRNDLARTPVFTEEQVRHIQTTLRPYLNKLHESGIYHRDLNVRNVMLGEDGVIYVIDFGKGVRSFASKDSVYDAQEGKYDDDLAVLSVVKNFGPKPKTDADRVREAMEAARAELSESRIVRASEVLGIPAELVKQAISREGKGNAAGYKRQFDDYVSGKAERTLAPHRLIRPAYSKPPKNQDKDKLEKFQATQAGRAQLLASLLLSERSEVEKFAEILDSVHQGLAASEAPNAQPFFGSAAKDSKARKFLPIFEGAVLAALGE